MKITDPSNAHLLIDELRPSPVAVQLKNLRLARENLELDQMYYQQKDNSRGAERCEECLKILLGRETELKA